MPDSPKTTRVWARDPYSGTWNWKAHKAMVDPKTTDWQPIATAPRDGEIVPCCWINKPQLPGGTNYRPEDGHWVPLRWKYNSRNGQSYWGDPVEYDDGDLADDQPTHWFRLPPLKEIPHAS